MLRQKCAVHLHEIGSSVRRHSVNSRNKAISPLGKRLDETRFVGTVPESFAQSVDGFVQPTIEVTEGALRPQLLSEFFPGNSLAGMLQQQHERLKRLVLQFYLRAPPPQLAGPSVDVEHSKTNPRHQPSFRGEAV